MATTNTQDTQVLVDELVNYWKTTRNVPSTVLAAGNDPSLPYDYAQLEDDSGAALATVAPPAKHALIVAEGDSWFDYPLKGDLLDVLRKKHGYTIHQVSKAGNLLEDMAYGVAPRFWGNSLPQIVETMQAVANYQPSVVLISGGGNDIAGDELIAFINRNANGVDPLRVGAIDHLIFTVFRRAYDVFIGAIQQVSDDGGFAVKILGHDYDFPTPDGRGYSVTGIIPGFSYFGPWLKPTFEKKGYSEQEGQIIIQRILKKFSELQQDLVRKHPTIFATVQLQGTLNPLSRDDWDNEMHPTWDGFSKIGNKVHNAIQQL